MIWSDPILIIFLSLSLFPSPSPSLPLSLTPFTSLFSPFRFCSLHSPSFFPLLPIPSPSLPPSLSLLCVCVCVCLSHTHSHTRAHTHTAVSSLPANSQIGNGSEYATRKGEYSALLPDLFSLSTLHLCSATVTATPFLNCLHVWLLVWILLGDLIWIFNVKALSIRSLTFCLTLITRRIMRGLFSGKRTVTALTEMMGNK